MNMAVTKIVLTADVNAAIWTVGIAVLGIIWFALVFWSGYSYLTYVRRFIEQRNPNATFSSFFGNDFLRRDVQRELWAVPLLPPSDPELRRYWRAAAFRIGITILVPVLGVGLIMMLSAVVT